MENGNCSGHPAEGVLCLLQIKELAGRRWYDCAILPQCRGTVSPEHPRLRRERKTIQAMIRLYCSDQHAQPQKSLCSDCQELEDYALDRLARCPFQENKSVCARCTVHCYRPEMRLRVSKLMRYAGPRMLLRHPLLAVRHLLDERRKPPVLKNNKR